MAAGDPYQDGSAQDQPVAPLLPPRAAAGATNDRESITRVPDNSESAVEGGQSRANDEPRSVSVGASTSTYRRRIATARRKRRNGWLWSATAIMVMAAAAMIGVTWWMADGDRRQAGVSPARERRARNSPNNHGLRASVAAHVPDVTASDDTASDADSATIPGRSSDPEPAEVDAVAKALHAARCAMSQRDLAAAARHLDQADVAARHPATAARVSQSRTLLHYVQGFWNAVDRGMAGLRGGQELIWRDQRTIVVEADASRLVLRVAGLNRAFQKQRLPADLAVLLAERWLAADDPNSHVFTAAFHSVDPNGDLDKARTIFRAARAQGVEAADELLAILDAAAGE